MAVAAVGLTGISGTAGFLITVGAAVVDATVLMPALQGRGRRAAIPPRLLDAPVGSNEPGAPRIWLIGRGRAPTHILWQKEKVIEPVTSSNRLKQGTTVTQRQVMIDCLLSLNDRKTAQMTQLIGNGKLLMWDSRNLIRITTHEMSAAVSGSDIVITMANTLVPSPTDRFVVGDVVKLYGWVSTSGASINGTYWGVKAIVGHTSTPGTITLEPAQGQVVAGVAANAGNAFTPAHIERVDDALVAKASSFVFTLVLFGGIFLDFPTSYDVGRVFNVGDIVRLTNIWLAGSSTMITQRLAVRSLAANRIVLQHVAGDPPLPQGGAIAFNAPANDWPRIEFFDQNFLATPFFPAGFVPRDHFHDGSEDQGEDPILVAEKGPGNVPAYRGVAYQAIDEFRVTMFGGQLPYSLEAIIQADVSMTWAQALYEVLRRAGIPSNAIDVTGVELSPFLGYYIRGFVPTATAIQPLLLAKQIVGQERDGTICLFQIENADVTQIQNGPLFSDLGAHVYGEPRGDDKIKTEDGAQEDLPTFIGVRHQDPDNAYADGYQTFGLRHPTGPTQENRQEIDISTLALSRKDAKNTATTSLRRAHVNNRSYEFTLPASYIHLLENDIVTLTDDDGNVITARIIQRDIGSNYLVKCVALREDIDLAVSGSPVQQAAGLPFSPSILTPAVFDALVLDCSSLADDENHEPMLRLPCCAREGSHWAGGRLFETVDGSNWSPVAFLSEQSVIGALTEPTPSVAGPSETYGSAAVTFFTAPVDVEFSHEGHFGIVPCSQAEALNGRNLCAIVDATTGEIEFAAFTQATLIAPHTYTLDGWLRGLRGTTTAVRPANSKLVMLGPANEYPTTTRRYPGLSQTTAMAFKFVPAGLTIEDVEAIQIVATWRNCRPLRIRKLVKTIGSSPFNARFETEHWTKQHLPVGAVGPYAMDEPFESYRLTIYDPSGNAVRRVKLLAANPATGSVTLRDKWFDYPASEQTADGYTPSGAETFIVDVQQVGFLGQISGLSDSNKQEV